MNAQKVTGIRPHLRRSERGELLLTVVILTVVPHHTARVTVHDNNTALLPVRHRRVDPDTRLLL